MIFLIAKQYNTCFLNFVFKKKKIPAHDDHTEPRVHFLSRDFKHRLLPSKRAPLVFLFVEAAIDAQLSLSIFETNKPARQSRTTEQKYTLETKCPELLGSHLLP